MEAKKEVNTVADSLEIRYFDKPFKIKIADERTLDGNAPGDFALTFAEKYIEYGFLQEERKLLIVRGAIGGTGFMKKHWCVQDIVYKKMIEMTDYALMSSPENRVVAFFVAPMRTRRFREKHAGILRKIIGRNLKRRSFSLREYGVCRRRFFKRSEKQEFSDL